ncbi:16973_t:CDS:1, partial [Dentiscutata heterogama]
MVLYQLTCKLVKRMPIVVIKKYAKATSNIQQLDANTLDPEANTLNSE